MRFLCMQQVYAFIMFQTFYVPDCVSKAKSIMYDY